jgi:hypothetical protein
MRLRVPKALVLAVALYVLVSPANAAELTQPLDILQAAIRRGIEQTSI